VDEGTRNQRYGWIIGVLFFAGALALTEAVKLWLRTGLWAPYTLRALWGFAMDSTPGDRWLQHPEDWIGLHRIVVYILDLPLYAVLLFSSLVVAGLWARD
jgi:hypothetical protein